jgi:hypothetical protein
MDSSMGHAGLVLITARTTSHQGAPVPPTSQQGAPVPPTSQQGAPPSVADPDLAAAAAAPCCCCCCCLLLLLLLSHCTGSLEAQC